MATNKVLIQVGSEVVELSDDKLSEFNADREIMKSQQELFQAQAESKALARESALAKLAALGLTEEEIAAL
jgi:DNA-binding NarL/FixJ family response regulator